MDKIDNYDINGFEFAVYRMKAKLTMKSICAEAGLCHVTGGRFQVGKVITQRSKARLINAYNKLVERKLRKHNGGYHE